MTKKIKKNTIKVLVIVSSILLVFFIFYNCYFIILKKIYPLTYQNEVIEMSNKYYLDSTLVFAIIKTESNFNINAKSNKNAMGLMQLTKSTADFIAKKLNYNDYDLYNAKINIEFGCYYLNYLSKKYLDIDTVIVAYNAGEGNVNSWLNNILYSKDKVHLSVIPYKESENYLQKVQKNFKKYKNLYSHLLTNDKK